MYDNGTKLNFNFHLPEICFFENCVACFIFSFSFVPSKDLEPMLIIPWIATDLGNSES